MRVFAAAGCFWAAFAEFASAADFPPPPGQPPVPPAMYAPAPPPPPPFTWSGFYVGANGGFGFSSGTATGTITSFFGSASASSSGNMNGPIVGGQIGFNWQINSLVLGIEADGQWSNQSQSTSSPSCFGFCTINETTAINWFATGRARIGYAFDRILVYGTGGVAWMNASDTANVTAFGTTVNIASLSSTAIGYAVGAGVEAAITNNLSARAEYLFMSSSRFSATAPLPIIGGTITETAAISDSIVRAGLNWRFAL